MVATIAITWVTSCPALPSMSAGGAADGRYGEYAGGDGAPDAADAVDCEDFQRVVDLHPGAKVDGYVAKQSRSRAYGERAVDADEARRRE